MATQLPTETFLALACLVHADGRLQKNEQEGLRRAAASYGLDQAAIEALEERASEGLTLADITFPEMSTWQKALTYAFATWVAKADGSVSRDEHQMLAELGDVLGLEKARRDAARSATYDISALPGGSRPGAFDFALLEKALEGKLPGSFREEQRRGPGADQRGADQPGADQGGD